MDVVAAMLFAIVSVAVLPFVSESDMDGSQTSYQEVLLAISFMMSTFAVLGVRRARREKAQLVARLESRSRELDRTKAALAARTTELEAARSLPRSLSHELRTPLNAIIGFAQLLNDTSMPLDELSVREFAGDILSSGRRLAGLLDDAFDANQAGGLVALLKRANVEPDTDAIVLLVGGDASAAAPTLSARGYVPVCEADPHRALGAATEQPPSAIVLELDLPGMSGVDFVVQLRETSAARDVPVIVCTTRTPRDEERRQLEAARAVISIGAGGSP